MSLLEAIYQCRRGKMMEINIATEHLKDAIEVLVTHAGREYKMFPECSDCKFGDAGFVLKPEPNPCKETYDVKFCKLMVVSAKPGADKIDNVGFVGR